MDPTSLSKYCANCKTGGVNLKRCAKCSSEYYCSRDCQQAHWKQHKKLCGKPAPVPSSGSATAAVPPSLDGTPDKPFHLLSAETWLHNRSEKDTFKLLIDTYRMRARDNLNFQGIVDPDSVFGGATDSSQGFRGFLHLVEGKRHLLPAWWTPDKSLECVQYGLDTEEWQSLRASPDKGDVIDHYNDSYMPMQLRMFGQQVYGTGPGGQDGKTMMEAMIATEAGGFKKTSFSLS
ncbi:hypothetical protein Dda_9464 [Drechslerella dactyloides]|uniref:MYND-type domain-containing protein n=1 Tax=Drechslerella dactyloides TaxID=74499 RepID=A0AAD6IP77_DREDA|nr:hypothetical protein Dda_9464 [Drechslerella dactyloides]